MRVSRRTNCQSRVCRIPIRPDVRAASAAGLAEETRFDVGEAGIVGPAIGGKATPLAAAVSDIEPRFRMRRPAATRAYVRPNYANRADPDSAAFVISSVVSFSLGNL